MSTCRRLRETPPQLRIRRLHRAARFSAQGPTAFQAGPRTAAHAAGCSSGNLRPFEAGRGTISRSRHRLCEAIAWPRRRRQRRPARRHPERQWARRRVSGAQPLREMQLHQFESVLNCWGCAMLPASPAFQIASLVADPPIFGTVQIIAGQPGRSSGPSDPLVRATNRSSLNPRPFDSGAHSADCWCHHLSEMPLNVAVGAQGQTIHQ